MRTLYDQAMSATRPWFSLDAGRGPGRTRQELPQQEIEICLMCPHSADSCGRCDGKGHLKTDKRCAVIDHDKLRDMMRLKRSNDDMCAALGISENTLIKYKKRLSGREYSESD